MKLTQWIDQPGLLPRGSNFSGVLTELGKCSRFTLLPVNHTVSDVSLIQISFYTQCYFNIYLSSTDLLEDISMNSRL